MPCASTTNGVVLELGVSSPLEQDLDEQMSSSWIESITRYTCGLRTQPRGYIPEKEKEEIFLQILL